MLNLFDIKQDLVNEMQTDGISVSSNDILIERIPPPHASLKFVEDHFAIYVFSLLSTDGTLTRSGRTLKVGSVQHGSAPRFYHHHYRPNSSNSNLAKSIISNEWLWRCLSIKTLDANNVGQWIKQNTLRDHLFIPRKFINLQFMIERYVRGRLGPVFEG
ncbi:hypothetical protein [Solidesulfovibrio carbinolicus]|uniref:hypothetical protein n=1 Tax=Solidesulfovibrio carbinolicus TaxID=296842 RepID=UPI0010122BB2|nr:hypothetical protein [Solidesulfovibrio carbinolicus]